MSLKNIQLAGTYSSEESSLLNDFYIPVLKESCSYDRAVGYFSSKMLSYAAQGLSAFVNRKGKIRLVLGEPLDQDEYDAIKRGRELQGVYERLCSRLQLILENADHPLLRNRLELMSWLVATNRLEIKIALTARGLFHEKMGVFGDEAGNQIVFQGSANETVAGLTPDFNFESIAVYPSWKTSVFSEYGLPYVKRFERLWSGQANHITTIDLPSDAYDCLKKYYDKTTPPMLDREAYLSTLEKSSDYGIPRTPEFLGNEPYELMAHQRDALTEWKSRDYGGIFALATGAGKTITALHGAVKLADWHRVSERRNFVLVVAVPYQVLADQWCEVMSLFNIHPIRCYRKRTIWRSALDEAISDLQLSSEASFLAVVVVNATMGSADYGELISRVNANDLMFVGDECHHHASASLARSLPKARYRLGLSATPWSNSNSERKEILKDYFGGIVASYSLGRALIDGVLVPYMYHIHPVELNDEEAEQYEAITAEIGKLMAIKEQGGRFNDEDITHLLLRRGRVLGSASQKFVVLRKLLRKQGISLHTLFYCGDGTTEGEDESGAMRDIERVARIVGEAGWKSSRFTAKESQNDRIRILENFRYGHIDAVVAIRVLDEGFDMPACRQAFLLASSRNDRQFIQRRGRILRRSSGKDHAVIHDFLVLPSREHRSEAFTSLVKLELERAVEFLRFSTNKEELQLEVDEIARERGIDVESVRQIVEAKEVVAE